VQKIIKMWIRFWMRFSGYKGMGRQATRLAVIFVPPYKSRCKLAKLNQKGFFSPSAQINHSGLELGNNIFIGDGVAIYQAYDGGRVELADCVQLHRDCIIETGFGGDLRIGMRTSIQPCCQFSAYIGSIRIGDYVQIAPNCTFYPYNHGIQLESAIYQQPLKSKGNIIIEDDTWLGVGVTVLEDVHIGKGAVIGAGSVVTKNIPEYCIAVGNPAKVIGERS
jgi:acetyltransferase-like isoleucine patch superfamily enzyme